MSALSTVEMRSVTVCRKSGASHYTGKWSGRGGVRRRAHQRLRRSDRQLHRRRQGKARRPRRPRRRYVYAIVKKFRFSYMQHNVFFILRGVQRHCVWAVLRLGVAACLACVAAAVDWQARRSCLVWCGGVNWPPDKCILRRSASGGRTALPDTVRHRPDTERTCLAVVPTQFTPPHQTRQNSPVCVVSGKAV